LSPERDTGTVSNDQRPEIQLDDAEGHRLHATWSRSRKRLILSVGRREAPQRTEQVELDAEQAERLRLFIAEKRPT
jgi:hypothetical protein